MQDRIKQNGGNNQFSFQLRKAGVWVLCNIGILFEWLESHLNELFAESQSRHASTLVSVFLFSISILSPPVILSFTSEWATEPINHA